MGKEKADNEEMQPRQQLTLKEASGCGVVVLSASLGLYLSTMHPSVAGGDSGELAVVASTAGVMHPPGYPTLALSFYTMKEMTQFVLPHVATGTLLNLFNVVISSISNTLLYFATARISNSVPAGVLSSSLFAFAPIVWTYATHIEVFGLNNLFLTIVILLGVEYDILRRSSNEFASSKSIFLLSSFCCGLALTNQHTSVLFVVPIVLWVLLRDFKLFFVRERMLLLKSGGLFLLGLCPYLYLPLSAIFTSNPNSWGDCGTLDGFLTHFFRKEYGTFSLASQEAKYQSANFKRAWAYYFDDVVHQTLYVLWIPGLFAILHSLFVSLRNRTANVLFTYALMLFSYLMFFHYLCNLPIDQPLFLGVQQRFWIQPLLLLTLFIGVGLRTMVSAVFSKGISTMLLWVLCITATTMQVTMHRDEQDQSGNFIVRDFGRAILRPLPKGAVVLTKGDIMINSARYVQTIDNFRPDVIIMDQEMMTYYWYVDTLKKVHNQTLRFPGRFYHPHQKGGFTVAQLFAANRKKRFFLAHGFKDGDHSWEGKYEAMPFGVIQEAVTISRKNDRSLKSLKRYLKETEYSIPTPTNMSLPAPGKYKSWTWEHVVKSDYWMAFHNRAYTLLDWHSHTVDSNPSLSQDGADYLSAVKAREIFAMLVEKNEPPNGIAARNLGVTIQGLLKYSPGDRTLLKEMTEAFKKYVQIVESGTDTKSPGAKQQKALQQIKDAVSYYESILRDGS
eukprot:TRINITY_DN9013_c2_g1_i1.p1 TRINITY_DN9013_c2_g1~~TRINITY_DN9013_c2_g1_i1.p1  ORF type:complete len:730 (+),score=78.45 TRINITY_DN9013_c2_g1_i1:95-2284(+)